MLMIKIEAHDVIRNITLSHIILNLKDNLIYFLILNYNLLNLKIK